MKLSPNITQKVAKSKFWVKKNAPHGAFGLGVAGAIGTVILASKATLKLEEELTQHRGDVSEIKARAERALASGDAYAEDDYKKDLGYVYMQSGMRLVKLYGPAAITGTISIALLTTSHVEMTRRNNALMLAVTTLHEAYNNYRERVAEEIGEEKEAELYAGVAKTDHPELGEVYTDVGDGGPEHSIYAKRFNADNPNWTNDLELNRMFVEARRNYLDQKLKADGFVFLNDAYDALGFDKTPNGQRVGWTINSDGDGYIDFGVWDVHNIDFINQSVPECLLDFNVDGVIWDKI